MPNRCYAYIRVSTVKQGERGSSLQEQRSAIESYAKRFNLTIIEWFEETETAAKQGRTHFTKMIDAIRKGKANGIIIHKIDRSARNLKDWANIGELIDKGIELHFAHENLDLHTRGGRLSADIQAVVAADFIRNLRDEVRKGIRGRLKQGLLPAPAPIGYLDNGGGKVKTPNPVSAPLIRQAYELYADGEYSLKMLGKEMSKRGLRSKSGKTLHINSLSIMLHNPFYYGLIRVKRRNESYAGIHEPIINKALFDRVQKRLLGKAKNTGLKRKYTFQKVLYCKVCSSRLVPELQKGNIYYRCHTRLCQTKTIREDRLLDEIIISISKLNFNEDILRYVEGRLLEHFKDPTLLHEQLLGAKKLQIAQIATRLSALTDAFLDKLLDRADYEERRAALLNDRLFYEDEIAHLEENAALLPEQALEILELLKALSGMSFPRNGEYLLLLGQKLFSNFYISKNNLIPEWKKPFDELILGETVLYGAQKREIPRIVLTEKEKNNEPVSKEESLPGEVITEIIIKYITGIYKL